MTALTTFLEPVRFLIGDDDPDIPLREDAQLLAAMRTILNLGRVVGDIAIAPDGYALSGTTSVTPDLVPADDPKAYAQLIFHTAKSFITDMRPGAWRTRAFSEVIGENREKVFDILEQLYKSDSGEMSESGDYE